MIILFFFILTMTFLVSGSSDSDKVKQTPAHMVKKSTETVNISCSHSINSYNQILWYKQLNNRQLQLLGYMVIESKKIEPGVRVKMEGNANKDQNCTLIIETLDLNSSAVYFCAASRPQSNSAFPAYFGQGTKLTVLEYDVKEPTVEVFRPSSKQCLNLKSEEKEKTLLCVAKDFYPDHISVSWESGGVAVTTGVATDSFAARDGEFYKISSRLRVNAEDWYEKEYECIVTFFNGTNYNIHTAYIYGEEAPKDFHIREKYLRATQTAKLSYTVFIIKSSIYGAFVAFLVWKLKGSSGKQNG